MAFSNQNTYIEYVADGLTTNFAINFYVLENSLDITAKVYDVTNPSVPIEVVIPYSIDHTNYPASEVVFTTEPSSGYLVLIERSTTLAQLTNFAKGAFPAEAVEESLDLIVMGLQEQAQGLSQAVVNPLVGPSYEDQIAQNASDIATIEADIVALDNRVTAVEAIDVVGLQAQADLSSADILGLQSDMTQAQSDIAQNASDIATLSGSIPAPISVVIKSATEVYNAADKDIVIVKSDDVTVVLPTATIGRQVQIKMDGLRANCIINSVEGIDGFGLSYQLSSTYEAITCVADGTQWYIL
jgi:hypothetical protein